MSIFYVLYCIISYDVANEGLRTPAREWLLANVTIKVDIYIYIYIEREREIERERDVYTHVCIHVYML